MIKEKFDENERLMFTFGHNVENTRELLNVRFDYLEVTDKAIEELKQIIMEKDIDTEEERYEYEEIYHSLRNVIRKKLYYFKNQTVHSRQFIYHSDSCISLVQVSYRDEFLLMTIYMRSCEMTKMLYSDMLAFMQMIKLINDEFFKTKKLILTIFINSLHVYKNDNK
jgi:hypothetical protein